MAPLSAVLPRLQASRAWALPLALVLTLAALPADARPSGSPRLPSPSLLQAPSLFLFQGASSAGADALGTPGSADEGLRPSLLAGEVGAGAVAALLSVPATLWTATWLGGLSSNLFLAAVPPLVLLAVVPPLAVTLAEVLVGNALAPGQARFSPAFWVTLGTHVLAVAAGVALGLSTQRFGDVALFTLAEAVLLPTAATLTVNTGAPQGTTYVRGPGLPPVLSVPVFSSRF